MREPLLAVLRLSPDFRPAYDPLLSMATALARSDAPGARTLLSELTRIQPARAEASQALALMDAGASTSDAERAVSHARPFRYPESRHLGCERRTSRTA